MCWYLISDILLQSDPMNVDDEISVEDKVVPVVTESFLSLSQSQSPNWPSSSSLTARLRRLITAFQRSYRQEQLKIEAVAKGDRRRRRCEQASKLKEIARQERQQRYTGIPSFYIAHRMQIISRIVIFTDSDPTHLTSVVICASPVGGHVERSVTSTAWYQRLVWKRWKRSRTFLRSDNLNLSGHASVPLLVWIKKLTRALVDTTALLLPCAGEFATSAQAMVKVTTKYTFKTCFSTASRL